MTNTSKTIIFFGTDDFSAASLRALIAQGFSIGAVVTKPDSQKGRGRKLTKSIVKEIAEQHAIPVWQPLKVGDIAADIQALTADNDEESARPIGVLVSYGKIIPESIINLFNPGIVNVHPSLLPKYRGPSPIESAILHGDVETGVTIMQLSKAMDAGPIYTQITVALEGTETAPELETKLAELGAQQLTLALPAIMNGQALPTAQNDSEATYCQLLSKDNSLLNTDLLSAAQAERQVRAYLGFPKTKFIINEHQIVITKAYISNEHKNVLDIACADGQFLTVDELIGPSGKPMNAKAFLNGYTHLT